MSNSPSREGELVVLAQKARDALPRYGNCAQASFAVLQEEFNLEQAAILKALGPLPGIAGRGEKCGAVVGCLMTLGLIYGSDKLEDSWNSSIPAAREFYRLFENEFGSTACGNLLEAKLGRRFDFTDPADVAQYYSGGGPKVCSEVVASAVRFAGAIIMRKF